MSRFKENLFNKVENQNNPYLKEHGATEKPLTPALKAYYNWFENKRFTDPSYRKTLDEMDASTYLAPEEIARDKEMVKNLDRQHGREKHLRGEILESAAENFDTAGWFGEGQLIPATKYDDYINHTDAYLFWQRNGKIIPLAIDFTTSQDQEVLEKKFKRIEKGLQAKRMTTIKYFDPEVIDSDKPLTFVPRVVIIINEAALEDLVKNLIVNPDSPAKKARAIADHQLKDELLQEIKNQLENQIKLTRQISLDSENRSDYDKTINRIAAALREVEQIIKDNDPDN